MMALDMAKQMEREAENLVKLCMQEFQAAMLDRPMDWNINVMPRSDKPLEWHFNVWPQSGSFEEVPIHGVMQFHSTFPHDPPTVSVKFDVKHPKIMQVHTQKVVNLESCAPTMWQPSLAKLGVLSLLKELALLFEGLVVEDSHQLQQVKEVYCPWCLHSPTTVNPPRGRAVPLVTGLSASAAAITVQNQGTDWRDATIPNIEISFASCYFEAEIVNSSAGMNDLCTVRLGWVVKDSYEDWAIGEPEMFVIANRLKFDPMLQQVSSESRMVHKKPFEICLNTVIPIGFLSTDRVICAVDFQNRFFGFYINGVMHGRMEMPTDRKGYVLQPYVGLSPNSHVQINLMPLTPSPLGLERFLSCNDYRNMDKGSFLWDTSTPMDWMSLFQFGVVPAADDLASMKLHEVVLHIFDFLTEKDAARSRATCRTFDAVLMRFGGTVGYKSKLKCWHSSALYSDSVLGMMCRFEHAMSKKRRANGEFDIRNVRFSDEFISLKSWDKGIHHDSSHEEFQYFLPLVIERDREERVLPPLKKMVAAMSEGFYKAENAGRLICHLMDASLVRLGSLWKEADSLTTRMLKQQLTIWSSLHYVLLLLAKDSAGVVSHDADKQLSDFIREDDCRKQQRLPSLGYIQALLLVSEKFSYNQLSKDLWLEMLARDASKYLPRNPQLLEKTLPSEKRLPITFNLSATVRKLGALQYWFNHVYSSKAEKISMESKMRDYSGRLGAPSPTSVNDLSELLDSVNEARTWPEFLRLINVGVDNEKANMVVFSACQIAVKSGYVGKLPTGGMPPSERRRSDRDVIPERREECGDGREYRRDDRSSGLRDFPRGDAPAKRRRFDDCFGDRERDRDRMSSRGGRRVGRGGRGGREYPDRNTKKRLKKLLAKAGRKVDMSPSVQVQSLFDGMVYSERVKTFVDVFKTQSADFQVDVLEHCLNISEKHVADSD